MMSLFMFTGEACLILIFRVQLAIDENLADKHKMNYVNPLLFAIPAFFDSIGYIFAFTGMAIISKGSYQMLQIFYVNFLM